MMKKFSVSLLTTTAILMFTGPLLASDDLPKATSSGGAKQTIEMRTGSALSAKDLMDMTVVNQQGEKIGQITDIRVDPDLGRINYVIVSREGATQQEIAVPLHALDVRTADRQAHLTVSEERLETAPSQANVSDEEFFYQLQGHYGVYPSWQIVPREQELHDPPGLGPDPKISE